jgi:hypothetical protein
MNVSSIISILMLVASGLADASSPKVPVDPAIQAAYDHFVGEWSGTDVYRSDHGMITIPVTIAITETKDKKSLRFDYSYGHKGEKDYSEQIRFLVLDPAKGEVTLNWQHDSKEHYTARELDEFVKTGYGALEFSNSEKMNGITMAFRCALTLTQDTLSYFWEESRNGAPFQVTGTFRFVRTPPPTSSK